MKRGGSDHRTFFLEAFNGNRYVHNRKVGGHLVIPELAISICGGIQPGLMRKVIRETENDGLAARMLWFWPTPTKLERPTGVLPQNLLKPALQRLLSLQRQVNERGFPEPRDVPLTEKAVSTFYDWCVANDAAGHESSKLAGFMAKRPGLILRIALVTTLLRRAWDFEQDVLPGFLEERDILHAIEFVEGYATPQAVRVFDETGFEDCMSPGGALALHIIQKAMVELNVRDIKRGPRITNLPPEAIDEAVAELVSKNWLRHRGYRMSNTPGRLQETYDVNPHI